MPRTTWWWICCWCCCLLVVVVPPRADAAIYISGISPANFAATGGMSITLLGSGLLSSPTISIGGTKCVASVWVSAAQIVCKASANGNSNTLTPSAVFALTGSSSAVGTATVAVDMATITGVSPTNGPTGSDASLYITGSNFGSYNPADVVSVKGNVCATSGWASQTSLTCRIAANTVSAIVAGGSSALVHAVIPTGPGVRGDLTDAFTFDRLGVTRSNWPGTGGVSVSVLGSGFGTVNITMTAKLGATDGYTEASVWIADSCMVFKVPALSTARGNLTLAVTVYTGHSSNNYKGVTANPILQADALVAVSTPQTMLLPTTGATTITVIGTTMSHQKPTTQARVGRTSSQAAPWVSETTVTCKHSSASVRSNGKCALSAGLKKSTALSLVSYVSAVATKPSFTNGAPGGTQQLTVFGVGYGKYDSTVRGHVGYTNSEAAMWVGDSSVMVKIPSSSWLLIASNAIVLTAASTQSAMTQEFSYNLLSFSVGNMPASGARIINMVAYGFFNTTPTVTVGLTQCESAVWVSTSIIACKAAASETGAYSALVQLGAVGSASTLTKVSVDLPQFTTVNPINFATTGATSLTLLGCNMNTNSATQSANWGGTAAEAVVWLADTTLTVKMPQAIPQTAAVVITQVMVVQTVASPLLIGDTPPVIMLFIAATVQLFNVDIFQSSLAAIISVAISEIQVLSVAPASVRVTLRILRQDWREKYQAMVEDLSSADSQLRQQLHVASIEDFTTGTVTEPQFTGSSPGDTKYAARIALSVVAAAVGTAFVLLSAYSIFVIVRAARSRKFKEMKDKDEAKRVEGMISSSASR